MELLPDTSTTIPTTPDQPNAHRREAGTNVLPRMEGNQAGQGQDDQVARPFQSGHPRGCPLQFPDELTLSLDGSDGSTLPAVRLDSPAKLEFPTDDDTVLEMALVGSNPVTRASWRSTTAGRHAAVATRTPRGSVPSRRPSSRPQGAHSRRTGHGGVTPRRPRIGPNR